MLISNKPDEMRSNTTTNLQLTTVHCDCTMPQSCDDANITDMLHMRCTQTDCRLMHNSCPNSKSGKKVNGQIPFRAYGMQGDTDLQFLSQTPTKNWGTTDGANVTVSRGGPVYFSAEFVPNYTAWWQRLVRLWMSCPRQCSAMGEHKTQISRSVLWPLQSNNIKPLSGYTLLPY